MWKLKMSINEMIFPQLAIHPGFDISVINTSFFFFSSHVLSVKPCLHSLLISLTLSLSTDFFRLIPHVCSCLFTVTPPPPPLILGWVHQPLPQSLLQVHSRQMYLKHSFQLPTPAPIRHLNPLPDFWGPSWLPSTDPTAFSIFLYMYSLLLVRWVS